jgi:WD40 repeat protein
MDYNEYSEISLKLYQKRDHQFKGVVSCISIVQDYLFVGNSQGIIRVFDIKSQKEMKPLMDAAQIGENNKVTSIDISFDGGFLISGYKGGEIALWDLVGYKLLKVIAGLHKSDVINAKIYYMDEAETIYALSAEDQGMVQFVKFAKKNFLGGYASEAQFLFKQRLKGTAALSVQRR